MRFVHARIVSSSFVLLTFAAPGCTQPGPNLDDGTNDDTSDSTSDSTGPDDPDTTAAASTATTDETGIVDSGASETGMEPTCGNGIVEADETCDDEGESATCDVDCTEVVCGDQVINTVAGEICEGVELGAGTCEVLGFDGGMLFCDMACSYDTSGCGDVPAAPTLMLSFAAVKQFDFSWAAVPSADYYQIEESVAPGEPFVQVGGDVVGESISLTMPLHFRHQASYRLRACSVAGCADSAVVDVMSSLAEAVGYFKASNTDASDWFGHDVALSDDGRTLAVSATLERSNATGIDGDQANDSATNAGAVYVFMRDDAGAWSQQAYIKASNTDADDYFGWSVALSADGSTLAVGAIGEGSGATGIDGDQIDDSDTNAGAVYVFVRDGIGEWSQQAYVKASNTGSGDYFGYGVALSGDGDTLAAGARFEDSNATGIDGDQANNSAGGSGQRMMRWPPRGAP